MKKFFGLTFLFLSFLSFGLNADKNIQDEFIKQLNNTLEAECIAYTQYGHDASKTLDKELITELIANAKEELAHAKTITGLIKNFGGKPKIDIEKIDTPEIKNMLLAQKPATEQAAITDYKKLIVMAQKLHNLEAQKILADILMQEEEHLGEQQTPKQIFDWE